MREARPQPLLRDPQHAVAGKESFTECSEDCHSQGVSERQALVDSETFSPLGLCEVHNAGDVVKRDLRPAKIQKFARPGKNGKTEEAAERQSWLSTMEHRAANGGKQVRG